MKVKINDIEITMLDISCEEYRVKIDFNYPAHDLSTIECSDKSELKCLIKAAQELLDHLENAR
jgi:hypothetical protein